MSTRREIPYFMAFPTSGDDPRPDSAKEEILAVVFSIIILLVIFVLASVIPGTSPG